jgi:hypothetical protein
MILRFSHRHGLVWQWPNLRMPWFFWGWKPEVFDGVVGYRIGPLTYWKYP